MEYLLVYLISGFSGWLIESIYNNKRTVLCSDTINRKYLGFCAPFLHLWALGGVVLLFISKQFPDVNILLLSVISGILLTVLEGISGMVSHKVNGYHTWNYDNHILPMIDGYVALDITIIWIIISFIFLQFYSKIF